ncbi:MAG: ThiF family adenylyltransferase [Desulfobulbus sp.]
MLLRPIVHNTDIRRLQDEGYEVEIRNGHLLVHSVPYVTSQRTVDFGIIVSDLNGPLETLARPKDHQVWFSGEFPCNSAGKPIEALRHSGGQALWTGFAVQHRFSNKPASGFPDYYSKMKSYINIISNEARVVDPQAVPCAGRVILPVPDDCSVFRYFDFASSRSNILAVSDKLALKQKIMIVGLGGTGAYVLDLLAKTPVREIHLFDGDIFKQHNAFRAPGAASIDDLNKRRPKVEYYAEIYSTMRHGLVPHHVFINPENIDLLVDADFVFICVDTGASRKVISKYLREKGIPFVDVGMDLQLMPEENEIFGTCRATLATPDTHDHFDSYAPQGADTNDDLYRSNIQVADMNALNAALAVLKWKQFCGFYRDHFEPHHTTFSVDSHSLTRDVMKAGESF